MFRSSITGGPIEHGFDTYIGDDIINWPPYSYIRDNRTVGNDLSTPATPVGNPGPYIPPGGNLAGLVSPGYSTSDVLPVIANQAVSYIGAQAAQPNPFFLYLPLTAPHTPISPLPQNLVPSTGTGPYGDFIAAARAIEHAEEPAAERIAIEQPLVIQVRDDFMIAADPARRRESLRTVAREAGDGSG